MKTKILSLIIIFMWLIIVPVSNADISSGPYLQPTDDLERKVVVAWKTSTDDASGIVRYRVKDSGAGFLEMQETPPSPTTDHYVELTGLTEGTIYEYQLLADSDIMPQPGEGSHDGDYYEFKTSPRDNKFRFLIMSDIQGSYDRFEELVPDILAYDPDVVMITGDLCGDEPDDTPDLFELMEKGKKIFATAIFAPSRGNHDSADVLVDYFHLPENGPVDYKELCYSFDYGGVHFLIADYYQRVDADWLDTDLSTALSNGANFIFAGTHDPAYSASSYRAYMDLSSHAASRVEYYDKYDVDIEFAGHQHTHFRTLPIMKNPYDIGEIGLVFTNEIHNYNAYTKGTIYHEVRSTGAWPQAVGHPCLYMASSTEQDFLGFVELTVNDRTATVESYAYDYYAESHGVPILETRMMEDWYMIDKSDTTEAPMPVISNVRHTVLGAYRTLIEWTSDIPTRGQVEFGLSSGDYTYKNMREEENQVFTTEHSAILQALIPGRNYYYRVKIWHAGKEDVSAEGSFTTANTPGSDELVAEYDFGPVLYAPEGVRTYNIFDDSLRHGWSESIGKNRASFPPTSVETYSMQGNWKTPAPIWRAEIPSELPNNEFDVEVVVGKGGWFWLAMGEIGDQRVALEHGQAIFEAPAPNDAANTVWFLPAAVTISDGYLDLELGFGDPDKIRYSVVNRVKIWTKGHYDSYDYDIIYPSPIADLTASNITSTSATLTWTFPRDDLDIADSGPVARYVMNYKENPPPNAFTKSYHWDPWWSTTVPDLPPPHPAGTVQTHIVTGLEPNSIYAFVMRSWDEVPNMSATGNILTITTSSTDTLGDVNYDTEITMLDAILVAKAVVGIGSVNTGIADVDKSGTVTLKDAMLIGQFANRVIAEFPVE